MKVEERANSNGEAKVRLIDTEFQHPVANWTYDARHGDQVRVEYVQMPTEICALTVDQARRLAPKLMEWLIKKEREK